MAGKKGRFRDQHAAMVLRSLPLKNPISDQKSGALTGHGCCIVGAHLAGIASGSGSPAGVPPPVTVVVPADAPNRRPSSLAASTRA